MKHQIGFKFSGNIVMILKYYKTIPCFSDDEQTVRSYVYSLKLRLKKVIFFGLLRIPMMTLLRQPVFLVSTPTFLSFFYQQFYHKLKLTHTNFQEKWMKIMRDITQLHELSEQPTYMRLCVRNPTIWVSTRFDTNRVVQSQKKVTSLKFRICGKAQLYYPSSENKGSDTTTA